MKNKKLSKSSKNVQTTLPKQQYGGVMGFFILIALIVGMVFFTLYCIKLDHVIVQKFEGKRWNIPAKVYSRPLELYQGANVSQKTVNTWLELLNYRESADYNRTGSFYKQGNTYFIHTRGFDYNSSDVDKQQVIKLSFQKDKIESIQSTEPSKTGIIRLEPISIGGIYPDNNEDRVILALKDIPQPLIDALIATEDRSFYEHKGVSLRGIARAIINNFSGHSLQGGSTITQQLIKNFYLNADRNIARKINEAIMAVLLEVHYSKAEILQTYLNEIYLGQNGNRSINGFGLASQFYFNRPLNEIRIDQMALLVGLAKGPSYYNPRAKPERALERRNVVLNNMLVMGKLSQEDYDKAIKQPLDVVKKPSVGKSRFPDFLDIVKRELNAVYYADDLKNEGLRIISTLDPMAQIAADDAMRKKLSELRKNNAKARTLQGALVSASPETGELVSVIGSGSEFTGFNRAIDAKRQVGSLLKPVIYMMALESGKYNVASSVDDSAITVKLSNGKTWSPKNYGGRDHGDVPLSTALAKSYNQAAVRLGMEFGVGNFVSQLHRLGIKENIPAYPSTLLGSVNLSPMDMLGVYQVFAAGGFSTPIHSIRTVVDDKGRLLQRTGLNTQPVISPTTSYLTNYALQQVVDKGTANRVKRELNENLNLAGKTGTTNDYRDAWFAGYSGNYVSVVWVGRDDNKPIGLSGSSGALPVWIDYMKRLQLSPVSMAEPKGIEWLWLENNSGKLSNENCPEAVYVPVLSSHIPKEASECTIRMYEEEQEAIARAKAEAEAEEQEAMNAGDGDTDTNEGSQTEESTPSKIDSWFNRALEWF